MKKYFDKLFCNHNWRESSKKALLVHCDKCGWSRLYTYIWGFGEFIYGENPYYKYKRK